MKTVTTFPLRIVFLAFLLTAFTYAAAAEPLRITVKTAPAIDGAAGPLSGRLLLFMRKASAAADGFGPDFTDPNAVWVSGIEVNDLSPAKSITFDPDLDRFPSDFAKAPAGDYQLFALLDRDHSYTYYGADGGDVFSSVVKISLPAASAELTLYKTVPQRKPVESGNARIVEFVSPMLSAFWGRPITMQATVLVPPGYANGTQKYPTVYSIHGYGGDHRYRGADALVKSMADGKQPEMIYVFLNAHNSLGHHVFADSVNNGPWGTALVSEFIPYLEKHFRMDARPSGRLLTGHSSGGWSSLWVMVTHPDFFGGTWSTSPDPTDFRNFTGPDLTNPSQNAYADASGKDYGLVRMNGKDVATLKQYAQQEIVLGDFGGQFGSFNAVFSPKGPDGRPMPLFDVETGTIDPLIAKAWGKYDISRMLRDKWKTLGPKLKGKLHLYVGTADTFHLDESLRLLDGELKKLGSDARVEYLPGRTHFDLYKDGLREKIAAEMYSVARPKIRSATK